MGKTLELGALGTFLGALIGVIWELSSPDGFQCLSFTPNTSNPAFGIQAFFMCWIVVLVAGAIGGAVGAILGGQGGHSR